MKVCSFTEAFAVFVVFVSSASKGAGYEKQPSDEFKLKVVTSETARREFLTVGTRSHKGMMVEALVS